MNEGAVEAAILAKLHADTTLRGAAYLNKSSFPYGIYRHGYLPRNTPPFPMVTVEFVGGPTTHSGAWEDTVALVMIRVYHGDASLIHDRIEKLLNLRTQRITATNAEIRSVSRTERGPDLWDDEFQVHYRPDQYIVRYRLHGGVNL